MLENGWQKLMETILSCDIPVVLDNMMVQVVSGLGALTERPNLIQPAILIFIFIIGYPNIVNGYATNEISLHSIHCIVSSKAQFET